jgi:hypothetical protein
MAQVSVRFKGNISAHNIFPPGLGSCTACTSGPCAAVHARACGKGPLRRVRRVSVQKKLGGQSRLDSAPPDNAPRKFLASAGCGPGLEGGARLCSASHAPAHLPISTLTHSGYELVSDCNLCTINSDRDTSRDMQSKNSPSNLRVRISENRAVHCPSGCRPTLSIIPRSATHNIHNVVESGALLRFFLLRLFEPGSR